MTLPTAPETVDEDKEASAAPARSRNQLAQSLLEAIRRPTIVVSFLWLLVVVLASAAASLIWSLDPLAQDLRDTFGLPSSAHPLGTDQLGRDIFARLLHGGGELLFVAVIPVSVAYLIAVPSGLLVGYVGGVIDRIADFCVSVLLAVPTLVIVLAVAVISKQDLVAMTIVMGIMLSGGVFRLVRATTSASRDLLYVDAARVSGVRRGLILGRHILPNIMAPLIVQAFLMYSGAFLFLTSLSFLGIGFDPETPSWGGLVADASADLDSHPWLMVPIGAVLIATVGALNFLGNSILDTLPTAQRLRLLTPSSRARMVRTGYASGKKTALPRAASTNAAPVVLEAADLSVSFRQGDGSWLTVVDDVDFRLRAGETLCLVGESGCGKTMTALALLGLLPEGGMTQGSVRIAGEEALALSETAMSKMRGSTISLISQEPMVALDPCFSVRSQIGEVVRTHHRISRAAARAKVIELLELVGIPDAEGVSKSFPHQLSGGMAQRVCIAMALAGEPDIIVADEPTTALDPTIQAEILDLLRDLQDRLGVSLVLVTHDLGVVADIGDVAAVMYAGQIVEFAPVETLLSQPQHPYSQGLLNAVPERAVRGQRLPTVSGVVPLPRDWPSHCRFAARCSFATETCLSRPIELTATAHDHETRCTLVETSAMAASPRSVDLDTPTKDYSVGGEAR